MAILRASALILWLLLTGGTAALAGRYGVLPDDLTQWTDPEICRGLAAAPDAPLRAEAAKRDLGDCTPAHLRCRANGYASGSDAYRACRLYLATLDAIEAGRSAPSAIPGIPAVPSTAPTGAGNSILYSFPGGRQVHCATLRNLISCF